VGAGVLLVAVFGGNGQAVNGFQLGDVYVLIQFGDFNRASRQRGSRSRCLRPFCKAVASALFAT
jgi:hypothetical protein